LSPRSLFSDVCLSDVAGFFFFFFFQVVK